MPSRLSSIMTPQQIKLTIEADVNAEFARLVSFAAPGAAKGYLGTMAPLTRDGRELPARYLTRDSAEFDLDDLADDPERYEAWITSLAYMMIGGLERLQGVVLMAYAGGDEIIGFDKEAFGVVYEPATVTVRQARGAVAGVFEAEVQQHVGIASLDPRRIQLRGAQVA